MIRYYTFQFPIIIGNICSQSLKIGDITIKPASSVALPGITIDSKFNFKKHIQMFF